MPFTTPKALIFPLLAALLVVDMLWLPLRRFFLSNSKRIIRTLEDALPFMRRVDRSLPILLKERSTPNDRLVKAFGLHNAFTSSDPIYHRQFCALAVKSTDPFVHDIQGVKQRVQSVITRCSAQKWGPCCRPSIPFDTFIQHITFCTILGIIFGVDSDDMEINEVSHVTAAINTLWCRSKSSTSNCGSGALDGTETSESMLESVNDLLSKWISRGKGMNEASAELSHNPLNIIIPAYETLWRVVGHAIIEALSVRDYKGLLQVFYLTEANFATLRIGNPPTTPEAYMQEILRLYPPTRRLSRVVEGSGSAFWVSLKNIFCKLTGAREEISGLVAIDIEALHRQPSIWSCDAMHFVPARFIRDQMDEQKKAFMPFGYGPLKCIASKWAPQVAAIITGAILAHDESIIIETRDKHGNLKVVEDGGRNGWGDWQVQISTSRN